MASLFHADLNIHQMRCVKNLLLPQPNTQPCLRFLEQLPICPCHKHTASSIKICSSAESVPYLKYRRENLRIIFDIHWQNVGTHFAVLPGAIIH